ncbi:hypothetical protein [Mesorhizobium loti]|uniref:hypothetical protein n=1 Tax=Rhizobium loti TaxID=381 RepID=UPI000D6DBB6A|nr:hypothetical protein [Mesorhizobium loti]
MLRKALGAAFRKWSDEPDLERIIVSHGDVITDKPREVLKQIARDFRAIAEYLRTLAPQPSRAICPKSSID